MLREIDLALSRNINLQIQIFATTVPYGNEDVPEPLIYIQSAHLHSQEK